MFSPKTILVLAPHTDDGELGCGGSIAKFASEGREIYYAAFCLCSSSLPPGKAQDTLELECKKATSILGIPESNLILFDYEVRELTHSRQKILEEMVMMNRNLKPDMVFIPASTDIHQDHQVIQQEALRAFKHITVAGYELPWNNSSFNSSMFIRLSEDELNKKVEALHAYESQSHRVYMQEDFTRSLAKVRGVQANVRYAEAFELNKWMV